MPCISCIGFIYKYPSYIPLKLSSDESLVNLAISIESVKEQLLSDWLYWLSLDDRRTTSEHREAQGWPSEREENARRTIDPWDPCDPCWVFSKHDMVFAGFDVFIGCFSPLRLRRLIAACRQNTACSAGNLTTKSKFLSPCSFVSGLACIFPFESTDKYQAKSSSFLWHVSNWLKNSPVTYSLKTHSLLSAF